MRSQKGGSDDQMIKGPAGGLLDSEGLVIALDWMCLAPSGWMSLRWDGNPSGWMRS